MKYFWVRDAVGAIAGSDHVIFYSALPVQGLSSANRFVVDLSTRKTDKSNGDNAH